MNVFLQLPPAQQAELVRRATAAGQDVDRFVAELVESSLQNGAAIDTARVNSNPERWFAELVAWADSHPRSTHEVDDSRASIYGDDGCER
jgi:hypothetical protein